MAGDEVTGATTFLLEAGLDTGPVFGVMTETIRPRDTAGDLLGRLAEAGAGLLVATLDGIADGAARPGAAARRGVSLAPKIEVADARVRWDRPALAVDRLVRGCTPAPGAWTTFRGERLKLGPVAAAPADAGPAPGARRARGRQRDGPVGTGTSAGPARHRPAARQEGRWPPPTGPAACASSAGERFDDE